MKPILEVAYLTSDHGSTLDKCPGCKICDRIAELMEDVDADPNEKYKCLLDKGEDLTVSEIIYLSDKGVARSKIQQATGLTKRELSELLLKGESLDKKSIKVVETMGNFTMTFAEYKDLKAQGKTNKEIAAIAGIKEGNLNYQIKKWKTESEAKATPLKSKELAPVLKESTEYTKLINDLKYKLSYSEQSAEHKDELNQELTEQNKKLQARIDQLEQEKLDLHAAANDTEKEAAAAVEYLEKEEKLMIDLEDWKLQALQYKAENERLNRTLIEERQDKDKYKGDSVLFRSVLKAVL